MTKLKDKCLFCGRKCHIADAQPDNSGAFFYNCDKNCHQYFVGEESIKNIDNYSQTEKDKISNWLKNRQKIDMKLVLTTDLLNKIISE